LTEAHSLLEKRNEEFELKMKEVMKLREVIKTAEQEKFQELDKVLCSITSSSHRVVSMDTRLRSHVISPQPGACFSKVPKLSGLSISGTTIPFISLPGRGSKPSNFAILLAFLSLKAC